MIFFQVAELNFSFDENLKLLAERMNYSPFMVKEEEKSKKFLFHLSINQNLKQLTVQKQFTYSNEIGYYGVTYENDIYEWVLKRTNQDDFYLMKLNVTTQQAFLNFEITDLFTMQAADDFTRFAFIYSAAFHHTILLHASCIKLNDKGIAFMGHSGIGKSTHSMLWLKYIDGSELLNDDQPAVHIIEDSPVIYGTPWSGKTMCYKQKEVKLNAIICMEQRPYNKLIPLSKIQLFTQLLSATSLIKTEKNTLKKILETLSTISEKVRGAKLQNKPEENAVILSHDFLLSNKI